MLRSLTAAQQTQVAGGEADHGTGGADAFFVPIDARHHADWRSAAAPVPDNMRGMESAFDRIAGELAIGSLSASNALARQLAEGASDHQRELARALSSTRTQLAQLDLLRTSAIAQRFDEAQGFAQARLWIDAQNPTQKLFANLLSDVDKHDFLRTIEATRRLADLATGAAPQGAVADMFGARGPLFTPMHELVDPYHGLFSELERSVAQIAFPLPSFEFGEHLGHRFRASDFFSLHRADEIRTYLYRTELPLLFVEAPAEFVDASLVNLGLVKPLRARQVDDASPRQLTRLQRRRDYEALRRAIEWLEGALRDKVDAAMTAERGDDWVHTLTKPERFRWIALFKKKQYDVGGAGYRPLRAIEASQLSELMAFALLSDECAPLIRSDDSMSQNELRMEIERLTAARNALFHGHCRANPTQITISFGILVKLAGAAGLTLFQDDWIRVALYGEGADGD